MASRFKLMAFVLGVPAMAIVIAVIATWRADASWSRQLAKTASIQGYDARDRALTSTRLAVVCGQPGSPNIAWPCVSGALGREIGVDR